MSNGAAELRALDKRGMKLLPDLEPYHDGELSWWRSQRMEAGLRRSPELRRELEALQQMSSVAAAADSPLRSPDLWLEISSQLHAIDSEKRAIGGARSEPQSSGLLAWKPAGWVAAAAAAMLAVGLWNSPGTLPPGSLAGGASGNETAVGVLRYLDTGGKSVMVLEHEDVTIIWLLDADGTGDGA